MNKEKRKHRPQRNYKKTREARKCPVYEEKHLSSVYTERVNYPFGKRSKKTFFTKRREDTCVCGYREIFESPPESMIR